LALSPTSELLFSLLCGRLLTSLCFLSLGAFVSFGILYDLAGFLIDRFKLSTFIMKLRTPEGPLQNAKHAIALAADDVVESLIVVALTMPLSSIIRRLTVQAGGEQLHLLSRIFPSLMINRPACPRSGPIQL